MQSKASYCTDCCWFTISERKESNFSYDFLLVIPCTLNIYFLLPMVSFHLEFQSPNKRFLFTSDYFGSLMNLQLELEYCCVKSVNRRNEKTMRRVWVHGKFQKPMWIIYQDSFLFEVLFEEIMIFFKPYSLLWKTVL